MWSLCAGLSYTFVPQCRLPEGVNRYSPFPWRSRTPSLVITVTTPAKALPNSAFIPPVSKLTSWMEEVFTLPKASRFTSMPST